MSDSLLKQLLKDSIKPVITSITQTGLNTARLNWNFSNANMFQRYRIQISTDKFTNDITEWPGIKNDYFYFTKCQFKKV